MAEYRLAPKARGDIEEIWTFSCAKWGMSQTEQYVDGLSDAFAFLAENSEVGTNCNYIRNGYRCYPVKRHVIYYRKTTYGIEVMRVLHDRMLAKRHL